MKRAIVIFLLAVSLCVLGMYIYTPLFTLFEPKVEGISLQVTDPGEIFKTSVIFSLILALSPLLIFATWSLGPIVSFTKRFATVLTVLAVISIAIFIRHQSVKSYFTGVAKNMTPKASGIQLAYPLDPVNFAYYMFAGLCIGCLLAYFMYREHKN